MNLKENLEKYLPDKEINKLIDSLALNKTSSLIVNSNLKTNIDLKEIFTSLKKNNYIKNSYNFNNKVDFPGKSFLFDNGLYYIMDYSSMMVSYFLKPKENSIILDMCASPGGKTISTNLTYKNLTFISNDASYERSLTLSSNIEKLGFSNVVVTCYDFLKEHKIYSNYFDYIILDAPCSGSAMFRKNSLIIKEWSIEKVKKYSEIQKKLLDIAIDMLKENGEVIYSTCSFSYEENEEVILDVLSKRDDIKLINLPFFKGEYRSNLKETVHFFPHLFNAEGQFIAKIKKISSKNLLKENSSDSYKFILYKNLKKLKLFNDKYNICFKNNILINNSLYGLNSDIFIYNKMKLIRYGLNYASIKNEELIPTFNLSHNLSSELSISLNDAQLKKYLHGEELSINLTIEDDYYIVSYKGLNLGIVKKTGNKLKNFYPKGLRR